MKTTQIKMSRAGIIAAKENGLSESAFLFLLYCSKYKKGMFLTYAEIASNLLLKERQIKDIAATLQQKGLITIKQSVRAATKKVTDLGLGLCGTNDAARTDFFIADIEFDDALTLPQNLYVQFIINRIKNSSITILTEDTTSGVLAHKNVTKYAAKLIVDFFAVDTRTATTAVNRAVELHFIYKSTAQNSQVLSAEIVTSDEIKDYHIGRDAAIDNNLVDASKLLKKFANRKNKRLTPLEIIEIDAAIKLLQSVKSGQYEAQGTVEVEREKDNGDGVTKDTVNEYKNMLNALDNDTQGKVKGIKNPSEKALFHFQRILNIKNADGSRTYNFRDIQLVLWEKIYTWHGVSKAENNLKPDVLFFHFEKYYQEAVERKRVVENALSKFCENEASAYTYQELAASWLAWRSHLKRNWGAVYADQKQERDALAQLWAVSKVGDWASPTLARDNLQICITNNYKGIYNAAEKSNFLTKQQKNDDAIKKGEAFSQAIKDSISQSIHRSAY